MLLAASVVTAGCGQRTTAAPTADPDTVAAMRKELAATSNAGGAEAAAGFQHSGGFVTFSGKVTVAGDKPQLTTMNSAINKDQAICMPGNMPVYSEQILIGAGGGLANVVIYVKKDREYPVHDSAKAPATPPDLVLDQVACIFTPHVLAVPLSLKVLPIKNSDAVTHNTKIDAERGKPANATLGPGATDKYALTAEENKPIPVSCTVHPWMKSYIFPRENGYFAVTDKDGNFKIDNLPTGDKLTFLVWHEACGRNRTNGYLGKGKLTAASAALVPHNQGFTLTLEKDKPLEDVTLEVPAAVFQ